MGFDLGSGWGSVIGAGISGLSGIAGGFINATQSKSIARAQMRLQKEFAQNGIQWKVDDARRAGIHPLYALGANTATYTPVSQDSSGLGNAVADAGAYLGKAVTQAIDKDTQKEIEQENLLYTQLMREGQLEEQRQRVRGLMLQNDEQEFLNARLASGFSANPVRPSGNSLAGVQGIYDIGGAYSNNPSVRSHLRKVRRNDASAAVGAPLVPAYGTTPKVVSGSTMYGHTDPLTGRRMAEVLSSEERSESAEGMDVFGFNFPNLGYQWRNYGKPIVNQILTGHSGVRPKVIDGTLWVYSPWDFSFIDTGMPVR